MGIEIDMKDEDENFRDRNKGSKLKYIMNGILLPIACVLGWIWIIYMGVVVIVKTNELNNNDKIIGLVAYILLIITMIVVAWATTEEIKGLRTVSKK